MGDDYEVTDGVITMDEALRNSSNPHEFSLRVKGIQATSDKTWESFEGAAKGSGTSDL